MSACLLVISLCLLACLSVLSPVHPCQPHCLISHLFILAWWLYCTSGLLSLSACLLVCLTAYLFVHPCQLHCLISHLSIPVWWLYCTSALLFLSACLLVTSLGLIASYTVWITIACLSNYVCLSAMSANWLYGLIGHLFMSAISACLCLLSSVCLFNYVCLAAMSACWLYGLSGHLPMSAMSACLCLLNSVCLFNYVSLYAYWLYGPSLPVFVCSVLYSSLVCWLM